VSCPICEKRKAERFCPAKGEKICAVCCGTEREVSIDCPPDCSYLAAAHRYEDQHQRSLPENTALLDVKVSQDVIYAHQNVLSGLAFTAAKFSAAHPATTDPDVLDALHALAETYKTLGSGILYEKPPDATLPRELYAALAAFLNESKQHQAERAAAPSAKDSEVIVWDCCARMGVRALAATLNSFAGSSLLRPNSSAKTPALLCRDCVFLRAGVSVVESWRIILCR
jgi:hypothetical protein